MALAADSDVEDALGRDLTTDEEALTGFLLEQASDVVVGYLGATPDPVPGAVTRVVASMVAAVLTRPSPTIATLDTSGYNTAREYATVGVNESVSSGPWLTKAQKLALASYRESSTTSVGLVSERYE